MRAAGLVRQTGVVRQAASPWRVCVVLCACDWQTEVEEVVLSCARGEYGHKQADCKLTREVRGGGSLY